MERKRVTDPSQAPAAVAPTRLRVVSGNFQSAVVTTELADPIVAEVGDANGPLAGVTIVFSTSTGHPEEKAVPDQAVSDSLGRVSTRWTMGRWAGDRVLGIEVPGLLSAAATAHVTPGPAYRVDVGLSLDRVLLGADARIGIVGQVVDTFDNRVAGLPLRVTVDSGGGHIISQPDPDTSRTDFGFTVNWQLGTTARRQLARIDAGPLRSPPLLVIGTIGQVVAVAGDSQRTRPGQPVPGPIRVRGTTREGVALGAGFPVHFFTLTSWGGLVPIDSTVTDSTGHAMLNAPWILEPIPGWQRLIAQGEFYESGVTIHAEAVPVKPARIDLATGGNQTGSAGNFVFVAPEVIIRDSAGAPLPGQPFLAEVVGANGAVRSYPGHRSDSLGRARVPAWRFGAPGVHQLRLSTPGLPPAPVTITATADSAPAPAFSIETRFHGVFPIWIAGRLQGAVRAWERVIVGDLPAEAVDLPADPTGCHPAIKTTIDDVLIFVRVIRGDGLGNSIGEGRVCRFRGSGLPLIAQITLDHGDLVDIDDDIGLEPAIVHLLGHALGFGDDGWDRRPGLADRGAFRFLGPAAIQALNWVRWSSNTELLPASWVPIGDGFEPASTRHWLYTLAPDVMTAGISRTSRISVVTAAAMRDLGYLVDDSKAAEIFTPGAGGQASGRGLLQVHGAARPVVRRPREIPR